MSSSEQFDLALAHLLQSLRLNCGLSQEALADQLRWDQATVSRIERGRRRVEVSELLAWVEETNGEGMAVFYELCRAWEQRGTQSFSEGDDDPQRAVP